MFNLQPGVAYLDNASTTQIVRPALEAMLAFETTGRANVLRGLYADAERATLQFAQARATVAGFIGASANELVFVKNATEGLNVVARGLEGRLGPGDEILVTSLEHHANLLPWWEAARRTGCTVRTMAVSEQGEVDMWAIGLQTRVIAATHVSNVLGTVLPIAELGRRAHAVGAVLVVDAAQSVAHLPLDVDELGCDALVFSAHKMYGPMGVGALYLRQPLGDSLEPLLVGGGMVNEIHNSRPDPMATYRTGPERFEAGTPNVTGVLGFAAAVEWLLAHRTDQSGLRRSFIERLKAFPGLRVYGEQGVGPFSFVLDGLHAHDVAQILAQHHVYVRAGHHCAAPLVQSLAPEGLTRVSLAAYNTSADVDRLMLALEAVVQKFA